MTIANDVLEHSWSLMMCVLTRVVAVLVGLLVARSGLAEDDAIAEELSVDGGSAVAPAHDVELSGDAVGLPDA